MIRNKSNLVLVGFMGSGKSATGRELAARLNRSFVDLDKVIASRAGMSIPEIFARQGESAFRELEAELAREAAQKGGVVIATGGGTIIAPGVLSALRHHGIVVWLAPPLELLLERVAAKDGQRPLAGQGPDALKQLYQSREPYYRLADYTICPRQGDNVRSVVDQIVALINPDRPTFEVVTPTAQYPYRLSEGLNFPELTKMRPGKVIVVTDDKVGPLYADRVTDLLTRAGWQVQLVVFPAGETTKSLANAERIWEAGFEFGLDRRGLIIALGGGVIGDLAGFAAATYMRGVGFVIIPTTLLAMVDSSVGGKVGINHERGKNLIGAFHHPRAVLAPIDCLATLDQRNLAAGWAEVVKSALIGDAPFFSQLLTERLSLTDECAVAEAVFRSVQVKSRIVLADEFETGVRKYLNLGHTLGHALEHALGFGTLLHGEAVAIGLVAAAYAAEKLGLADYPLTGVLRNLLSSYGLPVRWPQGLALADVIGPALLDKKNQDGQLTLIIPCSPGDVKEIRVSSRNFTNLMQGFRGEAEC